MLKPGLSAGLALAVLGCALGGHANGAPISAWINGDGVWSNPANWSAGVPDSANSPAVTALVNNGSTVTVDMNAGMDGLLVGVLGSTSSTLRIGAGNSITVFGIGGGNTDVFANVGTVE